MDQNLQSQKRRHSRSNVMLKATLEGAGESHPVVLRNLSENGALVKGESLPIPGSRILFHRDGLSVPSRIAWAHCNHAGVQFDVPLFPREVLRHVPKGERKPPPELMKRPGLGTRPLTAGERLLIESWATAGVVERPGE